MFCSCYCLFSCSSFLCFLSNTSSSSSNSPSFTRTSSFLFLSIYIFSLFSPSFSFFSFSASTFSFSFSSIDISLCYVSPPSSICSFPNPEQTRWSNTKEKGRKILKEKVVQRLSGISEREMSNYPVCVYNFISSLLLPSHLSLPDIRYTPHLS